MAIPARHRNIRNKAEPFASESHQHKMGHEGAPYRQLLWMSLLHLPLMYAIMFSMVYSRSEIFHNLNTLYMAGMMVAPMILLMPLLMSKMYPNKKINWLIYVSAVALFAVLFSFMRNQTLIGDKQFLRSMIPHHSGAVLMCERAKIQNREIADLCQRIIKGQTAEIEQMKNILGRM